MGNKILFRHRPGKAPIQTDEVNENQTVQFYCDVPFSVEFKSESAQNSLETNEDEWDAPNGLEPLTFNSSPTANGKSHRIKIKLKDIPLDGFDYSVIVDGHRLDPRVVPPH